MVAILILVAIVSTVSYSIYASSVDGFSTEYHALFYDFLQAARSNQTFNSCLAHAGESCHAVLWRLADVYGVDYISISAGGNASSYGGPTYCTHKSLMCGVVNQDARFSLSCMYACGD